jgi:tripartite-type tricarboxylate transporter receptor subunit TctC
MKRLVVSFALVIAVLLGAVQAQAQDGYPSRPLRLVVPLAPGGPTDFMARAVAQGLAATLGQTVVVDNKPGADGAIAARDVMASAPDGHTLLFAIGSMLAGPLQVRPPAFDWASEFAPVGLVGRVSFCLVVHPDVPARTITEFVAYARANPDRLNFSTSTLSELMAAAQFMKATGVRMTRVPYKGGTQAMPDLLAGRIQVMFGPVTLAAPQAKTGALRVLGTLLPQRSSALPDVPTLAEAGYPEVQVPTWQAVFVPAKTPRNVVSMLAAQLAAVLARPEVRAEFERRALFAETSTPQDLSALVASDQAAWLNLLTEFRVGNE